MTLAEQLYTRDSKDFNELLYDQTKNAPWLGASIGIHALAFGIFLLMPSDPIAPPVEAAALAMTPTEAPPEMKEEPPPSVE